MLDFGSFHMYSHSSMAVESEIFLERKSRLSCIFNIEPELNIAKWPLMNGCFGRVSQSRPESL